MAKKPLVIGHTDGGTPIVLPPEKRAWHMHIVGQSGKGKSNFIANCIQQDILNGDGVCLLDPHGELFERLVQWCATHRVDEFRKIHLVELGNEDWIIGLNLLKRWPGLDLSVMADAVLKAFEQGWQGEESKQKPTLREVLPETARLLSQHDLSLAEVPLLLDSGDPNRTRAHLTKSIDDPHCRDVWERLNHKAKTDAKEFDIETGATFRRTNEFLRMDAVRRMIGQTQTTFDIRKCMDEGEIVLVNLAPKNFPEEGTELIGRLIIRDIVVQAKRRQKNPKSYPFQLYIDECYMFLGDDTEVLLDQLRKFGVHTHLAHQRLRHLGKPDDPVYSAVMNGTHTKVVFGGLSVKDAGLMADELFEYDLEKPIEMLRKPIVVGYDIIELKSKLSTESWGNTVAERFGCSVELDSDDPRQMESQDETTTTQSSGSSTEGAHEALRPRLKMMDTALYSVEMLRHEAAWALRKLPVGFASVCIGTDTNFVAIPYADSGSAQPDTISRFKQRLWERDPFAIPRVQADELIDQRRLSLVNRTETADDDLIDYREPLPVASTGRTSSETG